LDVGWRDRLVRRGAFTPIWVKLLPISRSTGLANNPEGLRTIYRMLRGVIELCLRWRRPVDGHGHDVVASVGFRPGHSSFPDSTRSEFSSRCGAGRHDRRDDAARKGERLLVRDDDM